MTGRVAAIVSACGAVGVAGCAADGDQARTCAAATVRYADGQGAGGQIHTEFSVAVTTTRGCRLRGFPGVQLVDARGRRLPTHVIHDAVSQGPVRTVTLTRRHPGAFAVTYDFHHPGRGDICAPAPHAVVVRLPGLALRQAVPVDGGDPDLHVFTPCGGRLVLGPIVA